MRANVCTVVKSILAVACTIQLSPVAQATQFCSYEVFSPNVLTQAVAWHLAGAGISAQADRTRTTPDLREYPVLRAPSDFVGNIRYERDLITRASSAIFSSATGEELLVARERVYPCPQVNPDQTCYETTFTTLFGAPGPEDKPAFSIVDGVYGTEFFRYGNLVSPLSWRSEFAAVKNWLIQYYAETRNVQTIALLSPFAAIDFAITADPDLAPYHEYITISQNYHGGYVLRGRVSSHYLHSLLLQKFFDIGIYNVNSWVVIDTGFVLPFNELLPKFETCM